MGFPDPTNKGITQWAVGWVLLWAAGLFVRVWLLGWVVRLVGRLVVRLLGCWADGLLACWVVGLLGCWADGQPGS